MHRHLDHIHWADLLTHQIRFAAKGPTVQWLSHAIPKACTGSEARRDLSDQTGACLLLFAPWLGCDGPKPSTAKYSMQLCESQPTAAQCALARRFSLTGHAPKEAPMGSQDADAAACERFTGNLCVVRQRCDGISRVARVPHSVEGLPRLVDPLIGVRPEEVPLCLQHIAGQGSSRSGGVPNDNLQRLTKEGSPDAC